MAKESWLWSKLKDNLNLDFLERLENKLHPGWPDAHFLDDGHAGWMELKAEKKLPTRINFRPAQPLWLQSYWHKGGVCYVVLYTENDNKIRIWEGLHAPALFQSGGPRDIKPCIEIKIGPEGWKILNSFFRNQKIS